MFSGMDKNDFIIGVFVGMLTSGLIVAVSQRFDLDWRTTWTPITVAYLVVMITRLVLQSRSSDVPRR